jgi:hypothetical protein
MPQRHLRVAIDADTTGHERKLAEARQLIDTTVKCQTCQYREERIRERELRVKESRRRWAGRLLIAIVVLVLGSLAFYRFGHDPMASVQR